MIKIVKVSSYCLEMFVEHSALNNTFKMGYVEHCVLNYIIRWGILAQCFKLYDKML